VQPLRQQQQQQQQVPNTHRLRQALLQRLLIQSLMSFSDRLAMKVMLLMLLYPMVCHTSCLWLVRLLCQTKTATMTMATI
jgi:hypothetical protein